MRRKFGDDRIRSIGAFETAVGARGAAGAGACVVAGARGCGRGRDVGAAGGALCAGALAGDDAFVAGALWVIGTGATRRIAGPTPIDRYSIKERTCRSSWSFAPTCIRRRVLLH